MGKARRPDGGCGALAVGVRSGQSPDGGGSRLLARSAGRPGFGNPATPAGRMRAGRSGLLRSGPADALHARCTRPEVRDDDLRRPAQRGRAPAPRVGRRRSLHHRSDRRPARQIGAHRCLRSACQHRGAAERRRPRTLIRRTRDPYTRQRRGGPAALERRVRRGRGGAQSGEAAGSHSVDRRPHHDGGRRQRLRFRLRRPWRLGSDPAAPGSARHGPVPHADADGSLSLDIRGDGALRGRVPGGPARCPRVQRPGGRTPGRASGRTTRAAAHAGALPSRYAFENDRSAPHGRAEGACRRFRDRAAHSRRAVVRSG